MERRVETARGVGLAVAAGGGVGALARFAISGWVVGWAHAGFPWGTFAVNAIGSAALGLLTGTLARRASSPALRGFLLTGLCGGFTTFSTFDYETLALLQRAEYATAGVYALTSITICVAGVWLGFRLARGARRGSRRHASAGSRDRGGRVAEPGRPSYRKSTINVEPR